MKVELKLNGQGYEMKLLQKEGNRHLFLINDRTVEVDVIRVEKGIYSFLYEGKSYVTEVVSGKGRKNYLVSHHCLNFDVDVFDAEAKYASSRMKGIPAPAENILVSPMPGKVVRIPFRPGEEVAEGDTLIVISAMKMESEYKAGRDGKIKNVFVKEGQTIEGKQKMIELE